MKTEELKPCPFCGSSDLLVGMVSVKCADCHAVGPTATFDWNRRVPVAEGAQEVKCENCLGLKTVTGGRHMGMMCPTCHGTGTAPTVDAKADTTAAADGGDKLSNLFEWNAELKRFTAAGSAKRLQHEDETPCVITEENAAAYLEEKLWEFIAVAGQFPDKHPDDRTWGHVLAYKPRHVPIPALAATPSEAAPADPMDWPLPCDVTVGAGTIKKGCKLRTLVARMEVLHGMTESEAAPAGQSEGGASTAAARDVLAERQRQMSVEGWTPERDDGYRNNELAHAAAAYAYPALTAVSGLKVWPWHENWLKISDHRRNMVKAGALILAEIERLDRTALAEGGE
jgi:hypothetical protein